MLILHLLIILVFSWSIGGSGTRREVLASSIVAEVKLK